MYDGLDSGLSPSSTRLKTAATALIARWKGQTNALLLNVNVRSLFFDGDENTIQYWIHATPLPIYFEPKQNPVPLVIG